MTLDQIQILSNSFGFSSIGFSKTMSKFCHKNSCIEVNGCILPIRGSAVCFTWCKASCNYIIKLTEDFLYVETDFSHYRAYEGEIKEGKLGCRGKGVI